MEASEQKPIAPKTVRYIKLGRRGVWEDRSLDCAEIHFGFSLVPDDLCLAGDEPAIIEYLVKEGRTPSTAKNFARQILDFFHLGNDCLWITFARRHLWWAFAAPLVVSLGGEDNSHGPRLRRTVDGWHNTDIAGNELRFDQLSTRLTQIASYRQTICEVREAAYCIDRINGIVDPMVAAAEGAKASLQTVATELIAKLHWRDFETLVDLIFARSGWQRLSSVGDDQRDIDLELVLPTTGERAFVQVKSRASQAVLDDYVERYEAAGSYQRMFFVCHSGVVAQPARTDIRVWTGPTIADAAIGAGLFDWLLEKIR